MVVQAVKHFCSSDWLTPAPKPELTPPSTRARNTSLGEKSSHENGGANEKETHHLGCFLVQVRLLPWSLKQITGKYEVEGVVVV